MPTIPEQPHGGGRDAIELVADQLTAIDAWNRARRASDRAAQATSLTREMRLDLRRRTEVRRREQQAVLARADAQLRLSGGLLKGRVPTRAVLAHRNAWLRDAVAGRLAAQGVEVVGVFDDGADAAGTVVVEQPDLVLVEDRLPTMSGVEVVHRVREFAPRAVVGAQVLDETGAAALTGAGAHAVFTRRVPPADVAEGLLACLRGAVGDPVLR